MLNFYDIIKSMILQTKCFLLFIIVLFDISFVRIFIIVAIIAASIHATWVDFQLCVEFLTGGQPNSNDFRWL